MPWHTLATAAVVLIIAALPAVATGQGPDLGTVCARDPKGAAIEPGWPVKTASGQQIGTVSLTQCTGRAQGSLRVWLEPDLGGSVKVFDLHAVRSKPGEVILDVKPSELAAGRTEDALQG